MSTGREVTRSRRKGRRQHESRPSRQELQLHKVLCTGKHLASADSRHFRLHEQCMTRRGWGAREIIDYNEEIGQFAALGGACRVDEVDHGSLMAKHPRNLHGITGWIKDRGPRIGQGMHAADHHCSDKTDFPSGRALARMGRSGLQHAIDRSVCCSCK